MAVLWMDNFQIYGTDAGRTARMLNGIYAQANGVLTADPDPTAGGGMVLLANGTTRKPLTAAKTTLGIACRVWLEALPGGGGFYPIIAKVSDVNNLGILYLKVDPTGYLVCMRVDNGGDVEIGRSANPVITPNAWKHLEVKYFIDVAVGTVDVRLEGVSVLTVAATRTTSNVAGAVASAQNVIFDRPNNGANGPYIKDVIVWDSTTGFNNNFMGSCQVVRLAPDADISLNWTPSSGATGFNLINEVTPDDDVNYIFAPTPAPAAYKCSVGDVPVSVTSVRSVMPIHRSRKTDGGDGNIQIGLVSGASTGLGTDRPITTAYTYWWDIYDTDPATAGAWTRAALNAVNLQLNRTL